MSAEIQRIPSQDPPLIGTDATLTMLGGYLLGAMLHGGLDLMLVSYDASTNDNRTSFVVESKASRTRYRVTMRQERE